MSISKAVTKKITVLTVVIGLVVLFEILGLGRYFTLSYLKSSQEKFAVLYAEHGLAVIAAYMMIYISVTSLSLPGAAVMTLAGALFGLFPIVTKKLLDLYKSKKIEQLQIRPNVAQ